MKYGLVIIILLSLVRCSEVSPVAALEERFKAFIDGYQVVVTHGPEKDIVTVERKP